MGRSWSGPRGRNLPTALMVGLALPFALDREEHAFPEVGEADIRALLGQQAGRHVLLVAEHQGFDFRDRQRNGALAQKASKVPGNSRVAEKPLG